MDYKSQNLLHKILISLMVIYTVGRVRTVYIYTYICLYMLIYIHIYVYTWSTARW